MRDDRRGRRRRGETGSLDARAGAGHRRLGFGGGAGIQADIKTITALGAFAATAITALTAQNTVGVHGVMPVPPDFIRQQIDVVMDDIGADVIKIGMLGDAATIGTRLRRAGDCAAGCAGGAGPGDGGQRRAGAAGGRGGGSAAPPLLPMAAVITPNLPEAEALTGLSIRTEAEMRVAAARCWRWARRRCC